MPTSPLWKGRAVIASAAPVGDGDGDGEGEATTGVGLGEGDSEGVTTTLPVGLVEEVQPARASIRPARTTGTRHPRFICVRSLMPQIPIRVNRRTRGPLRGRRSLLLTGMS